MKHPQAQPLSVSGLLQVPFASILRGVSHIWYIIKSSLTCDAQYRERDTQGTELILIINVPSAAFTQHGDNKMQMCQLKCALFWQQQMLRSPHSVSPCLPFRLAMPCASSRWIDRQINMYVDSTWMSVDVSGVLLAVSPGCWPHTTHTHTLAHTLIRCEHEVRQQSVVSLTIKWRRRHFYNCSPQSNGTSIKARLECVCESECANVCVCVVHMFCGYKRPGDRSMCQLPASGQSYRALHAQLMQCTTRVGSVLFFPSSRHTHTTFNWVIITICINKTRRCFSN